MKTYQAVIFDLDGTLLNTLDDLHATVNYTLSALHCPLRSKAEVRSFVGNGILKLIERSLPQNMRVEQKIKQAYTLFCDRYAEHNADNTAIYPGMAELVQTLKNSGVKLAVVTNKADFAAQKLCRKFFGNAFTAVVGARENLNKKPSPDGVCEVLTSLNVSKEAAVYVGDSDVDYHTAKNAGIDCVLVGWGFRERASLEQLYPLAVIDDAQALQKFLL